MHATSSNYAQAFIRAQRGKLDNEKSALLERLLSMMKENGDERKIHATLQSILKSLSREENKKPVRIVSAVKLSEVQKEKLEKVFPGNSHAWEINSAILGGIMVEQGTRLYQMTVRHLLKGFE